MVSSSCVFSVVRIGFGKINYGGSDLRWVEREVVYVGICLWEKLFV